jgi:hypothetical protein
MDIPILVWIAGRESSAVRRDEKTAEPCKAGPNGEFLDGSEGIMRSMRCRDKLDNHKCLVQYIEQ